MSDATAKSTSLEPVAAILFSDGSAKPTNPGKIGWSVHGYTLTNNPPTRGAGHPKVVPTITGYEDKGPAAVPVQVVNYYDFMGWSNVVTTNNAAEVLGCAQALKYASTMPSLKAVTVYSDSRYTVDPINSYLPQWVMNNWKKRDGSPIQNQDEWKALLEALNACNQNGIKVSVKWVKGHGTNFGNNRADQLASIASSTALLAEEKGSDERISEPQGYWKSESERHAMLGLRGWFFTVNKEQAVPGEYFLCNQVKSDEFIGRREVDGAFGYVSLATPDPLLELVRERQIQEAREFDTLALARIDRVYDKAVCAALETYGAVVLKRHKYANNLHFINESAMVQPAKNDEDKGKSMPITEELYPAKLAYRAVVLISALKSAVEKFRAVQPTIENPVWEHLPEIEDAQIFDITSTYFDKELDKKGAETLLFKKSIGVPDQSIVVPLQAFGREVKFQQIFGIHMLLRNNLKRLEGTDVKVWLVAFKESPRAIRYMTVVKSNGDWSAWSGAHSNLIVFKEDLQ